MGPMWVMYYNRTGFFLGRASRTKETLPECCLIKDPGHLWILLVLSWCKWLLVCNDVPGGYLGCYTSCGDFDSLVAIVLVVFLLSYLSILCRDLMVMSQHHFLFIFFLLVATSVLRCNQFPPSHLYPRSRPQGGVVTSLSSAQLFFRSRP